MVFLNNLYQSDPSTDMRKNKENSDQSLLSQIREHYQFALSERSVFWVYELGELVNKFAPKKKRQHGNYGIKYLSEEIAGNDSLANQMWAARKIYNCTTKRELTSMISQAKAVGAKCSTSHVLSFFSVDDEKQRKQIIKACFDGNWSVNKLHNEVINRRGRQSRGRTNFKKLRTHKDALQDLLEQTSGWINRYEQLWFVADDAMLGKPISKVNMPELTELIIDAECSLTELVGLAGQAKQQLKNLRQSRAK